MNEQANQPTSNQPKPENATENPPAAPEAAPEAPKAAAVIKAKPPHTRLQQLPPYRVLLHDDERVEMTFVVRSIVELTPLSAPIARDVMLEAHEHGVAQVLVTHRERAELYQEQFGSKGLSVTIEPAAV